MAIQMRRGAKTKFDPTKMLPGEWAIVQSGDPDTKDGRAAYMAFASGVVKRMASYDDLRDELADASEEARREVLVGFDVDTSDGCCYALYGSGQRDMTFSIEGGELVLNLNV